MGIRSPLFSLGLILSLYLLIGVPSPQAALLPLSPDRQWAFAAKLFDEGQYRYAAEEFERFAFFFPDHPQRPMAVFNAGRAFLQARDAMQAISLFQELFTREGNMSELEVDARLMAVEGYLMLDNPDQALSALESLASRTQDEAVQDRAYFRMTWILIDQLDWRRAQLALARITPVGQTQMGITQLSRLLEGADTIDHKSPKLAGILSIVPGGGQLYTGRYQDALAAMVVNGGLFWASYESFDNDLNALGGMLALVGLGFYTANIYGAVSSAHKYNFQQQQRFAQRLKQSVRLNIGPGTLSSNGVKGYSIAMTVHFSF